MESKVKDEFTEVSNSYTTEHEEHCSASHIYDPEKCMQQVREAFVENSHQLYSIKANLSDGIEQDTKCYQEYAESCSNKEAFANHVSMKRNEACATGSSELLSTNEQTHINYYDVFQIVKIEINVDENNTEIKEDVLPFEFSNMMSSHSKENVNYRGECLPLEASSQLKNEVILDGAPTAKKTKLKGSLNKNCKKKKKVSVNHTSETRHELTHTDEKVFACNICDDKCNRNDNLKRHIKNNTGDKPFAYNMCVYKFTQQCNLKQHIRTHAGVTPFTCNFCDYKFLFKSHLERHIRTHNGEKPFACNICDYKCNRNDCLQRHLRTHSGDKPFACNICDYKCIQSSDLKKHMRTHTRNNLRYK